MVAPSKVQLLVPLSQPLCGAAAFERPVSVLSKEGLAEREAARAGCPSPAAQRTDAPLNPKPTNPRTQHSIATRAGPLPGVELAPRAGADPTGPAPYADLLAVAEKVASEPPGTTRTPYCPERAPRSPFWAPGAAACPDSPAGVEAVVVYHGERLRRVSGAGSDGGLVTARSQTAELCEFLGVEGPAGKGRGDPPGVHPGAGAAEPSGASAPRPWARASSGVGRWWSGVEAWGLPRAGGARAAAAPGAKGLGQGLALPFQPLTLAFRDISYSVELPKVRVDSRHVMCGVALECKAWACLPTVTRWVLGSLPKHTVCSSAGLSWVAWQRLVLRRAKQASCCA